MNVQFYYCFNEIYFINAMYRAVLKLWENFRWVPLTFVVWNAESLSHCLHHSFLPITRQFRDKMKMVSIKNTFNEKLQAMNAFTFLHCTYSYLRSRSIDWGFLSQYTTQSYGPAFVILMQRFNILYAVYCLGLEYMWIQNIFDEVFWFHIYVCIRGRHEHIVLQHVACNTPSTILSNCLSKEYTLLNSLLVWDEIEP